MAGDRISIDDLLARQDQPGRLLVTVEALADDEKRVKVTPYIADVGCLCSRALTVNKDAIESLTTTEEVHVCCGKRLMVVEVSFVDDTLTDVFQQLADAARQTAQPPSSRPLPAPMPPMVAPAPSMAPYYSPFDMYPVAAANLASGRWMNEPFSSYWQGATGMPRQTGWWSDWFHAWQCGNRQRVCEQQCGSPVPFMPGYNPRYTQCICECANDYNQCLDPHYQRQRCEPSH